MQPIIARVTADAQNIQMACQAQQCVWLQEAGIGDNLHWEGHQTVVYLLQH
jgi:hypothetical protein